MSFLNDLTFDQIMTRIAGYLIVVAIHGFALAFIATRLGDREPAHAGRLTLNPLVHISIPGIVAAVLFQPGWMRPLPLEPSAMRWGRLGLVVAYLGSLAVLLVVAALLNPLRVQLSTLLGGTAAVTVLGVLDAVQRLGLWFVVLNALPLPGLTGSLLLQAIHPPLAASLRRVELPAMLIFLLLLGTGLLQSAFSPLQTGLVRLLMH